MNTYTAVTHYEQMLAQISIDLLYLAASRVKNKPRMVMTMKGEWKDRKVRTL